MVPWGSRLKAAVPVMPGIMADCPVVPAILEITLVGQIKGSHSTSKTQKPLQPNVLGILTKKASCLAVSLLKEVLQLLYHTMSHFKKEKMFSQPNSKELRALARNWAEQMELQFLTEDDIWIQLFCDLQMLVHNIYFGGPLNCKERNLEHPISACTQTRTHIIEQ